ncbi:MAG: Maf family protein [Verrucomicrobiota bacterium]|nr:Maf family protein [Verrucomicrobiota bacterium]
MFCKLAKRGEELHMQRLLLASSSPRRHQLMDEAGYQFEICCSNVEEISDESMNAVELTIANAKLKADPVSNANPDSIVIGADTVVSLDKKIFGKPANLKHASVMLAQLAGRTHNVTTGVSILSLNQKISFHVITEVTFKPLSKTEILQYLNLINPLDKAGSYAAQEHGSFIIDKYSGSYTNVVGLPMDELTKALREKFNTYPESTIS